MSQTPVLAHHKKLPTWNALFQLTALSAYFYALMEWVFFATKPSSLSVLSSVESVEVLLITGGTIAIGLVIGLIFLSIPAWLVKDKIWHPRLISIRTIPTALVLSVTALILFDNFTYTVFKFGVISTDGIRRVFYVLGFGIVFWQMTRFARHTARTSGKIASILSLSLLAVSVTGFLTIVIRQRVTEQHRFEHGQPVSLVMEAIKGPLVITKG